MQINIVKPNCKDELNTTVYLCICQCGEILIQLKHNNYISQMMPQEFNKHLNRCGKMVLLHIWNT